MMTILFDEHASHSRDIEATVRDFLALAKTLEQAVDAPIVVFQDGKSSAYYVKCSLKADDAATLCDTNARLNIESAEAFRANRELLLTHKTYQTMKADARSGREFNDIIVEYTKEYDPDKPLKVWGGQHRIHAIIESSDLQSRHHGFRVYFDLSKAQRTEVAIISNINIAVSDDTFDRMVEETRFGATLRTWCQRVGLLPPNSDFPDVASKADTITVRMARTFLVNFYRGKEVGASLDDEELDNRTYDPHIAQSGSVADPIYEETISTHDILTDESLYEAGRSFAQLHQEQRAAVCQSDRIANRKSFRNKAFVLSVLCGWSHVAGLLQDHPVRLKNHYRLPRTSSTIPDPLNAEQMSQYRHNSDPPNYRGLGTRQSLKDRQRVVQLFLARSQSGGQINRQLMNRAVSKVVALINLARSY